MNQYIENKYTEEFKEILLKLAGNYPKHGARLYVDIEELKELITFVKKVCEKAERYDILCQ